MDKLKPSHDLEAFQAAFVRQRAPMTIAAIASARTLGFEKREGVMRVINALQHKHFVKSVTSFNDHKQWQDVYVIPWEGAVIYIKFTEHTLTEFILLSFKRK